MPGRSLITKILVPMGMAAALGAAFPVRGQFHIVPRQRLDSMANPALANGAQAMRFVAKRIETGPIGEDDGPKNYRFEWQNVGDKPLVITRITTTCGCAAPSWDRQPVKPGEKATVTVTYHPKGHPDSFTRKIFLFTQLAANAPTAILELSGELTVRFDPTAGRAPQRVPLFLRGVGLPPSQSAVTVYFDPATNESKSVNNN